jgi:hypothetical protein
LTISAYPLEWPSGWPRKQPHQRTRAQFSKERKGYRTSYVNGQPKEVYGRLGKSDLSIADGRARVLAELQRMGVRPDDIVLSTNLPLRLDGLPRSDARAPADPGAAVYWSERGRKQPRCMAIDRYDRVQDNLAAIAATLEAMRAIERHGGAEILDRAFTGFTALPAPEQPFQVLGVGANASREEVERAYRLLASEHHPDKGGDADRMARINAARDALLEGRP